MDIAIVGMACRYPDANSPQELWENVLAQRQAFRKFPSDRLNLDTYFSSDRSTPDTTYAEKAAVLQGYQFDRVKFRVVGDTYRSADLAHWLALDIADQALRDAGFDNGTGLPKETTGVLLGNTLTGELSRANTLRLRWPYVRAVMAAELETHRIDPEKQALMLEALEARFKEPFPEIGEESLAGNLANTIAGRICNHFDLKGGGYVLDGACSSSLLAVANACSALVSRDLDVALAGGVDLSLDPFELIGFAKTGALTPEQMWVYDKRSAGFIPGEGCGFIVLMRYEDAIATSRQIYAVIKGWGLSSDGHGGITRPEIGGQTIALNRAYRRAGFDIASVAYIEGHGTGTTVGDTVELQTLSRARQEKGAKFPAVIGSVKANIGHTKAAAGIAGLIKATLAIKHQILPPTTGCVEPHSELNQENATLKILKQGKIWSSSLPLRAGVSAMGFGGINTHIVLEGITTQRKKSLTTTERRTLKMVTQQELYLLAASNPQELSEQIHHLLSIVPRLSQAELGDLATILAQELKPGSLRAAVIAGNPQELKTKLETLLTWLERIDESNFKIDQEQSIFLGQKRPSCKLGFLFPGQAAPVYTKFEENIWSNHYQVAQKLGSTISFPELEEQQSTAIAQPAIVLSALMGLKILEELGITADIALGHSLGELVALHWAGAMTSDNLLQLAQYRGQLMSELGIATGTMASIAANASLVEELIQGTGVTIAGFNSPQQTIIAGEERAIASVMALAQSKGLKTVKLPVSRAFHSPLVAEVISPLEKYLPTIQFQSLSKDVFSTVTGQVLSANTDIVSLLVKQITQPVRFQQAISIASSQVDLWLEVGPGHILNGLTRACVNTPVISLDIGSNSLTGLFKAIGAIFTLHGNCDYQSLFTQRFNRPFSLNWQPEFIANPCEIIPQPKITTKPLPKTSHSLTQSDHLPTTISPLEVVKQLVAVKTELPADTLKLDTRLLSDLHLNSISVGELVTQAHRQLGLNVPSSPLDYATTTIGDLATTLETKINQQNHLDVSPHLDLCAGVADWIRPFQVVLQPSELPSAKLQETSGDCGATPRREPVVGPCAGSRRQGTPTKLGNAHHWELLTSPNYPLTDILSQKITQYPGIGLILCLPPDLNEPPVEYLYLASQKLINNPQIERFILVQHGYGAAGWVRTFKLEHPRVKVAVINVPIDHPQVVDWISAEVNQLEDYTEVDYDAQGIRRVPVWQAIPLPQEERLPFNSDDLILVTGGGKGIAAECALTLAKKTGVRLVLMGRSQPDTDPELNYNLTRLSQTGVKVKYIVADVTNLEQVQTALNSVISEWGEITGIIHGAGINQPKLISALDIKAYNQTLAPKVQGLRNVLQTIKPDKLRLLVSFGSIIARLGLPGEADYALANEWLGNLVYDFKRQYPLCHCLNLEWSVWSGVGMGERLGRLDSLREQGITPITLDQGVNIFCNCLCSSLDHTSVIISGRFGKPPTVNLNSPPLPFLRFVEKPLVYYPGVELVVETELSVTKDPYLNDHIFSGERIFPGVMGLEAMTQVASALLPQFTQLELTNITFTRPVVVSESLPLKIRLAALRQPSGQVDVVLRSEQTGFVVDHFRATISTEFKEDPLQIQLSDLPEGQHNISAEPFYGNLLFHGPRFQRLNNYHYLRATECLAELKPSTNHHWFNQYLPGVLLLGDPGTRDGAIHCLQSCIPHTTLLPITIDRLVINAEAKNEIPLIWAKERSQRGDIYTYDLLILNAQGQILESLEGLSLQVAQFKDNQSPWLLPLIVPYLERQMSQFFPQVPLSIFLGKSELTLQQLPHPNLVTYRLDGKPELSTGEDISVAHTLNFTLITLGSPGCDLEQVQIRTLSMWEDLLGHDGFNLAISLAQTVGESFEVTATRVWSAQECLKKAGMNVNTPLVWENLTENGLICLTSLQLAIATFAFHMEELDTPLVIAILVDRSLVHAQL